MTTFISKPVRGDLDGYQPKTVNGAAVEFAGISDTKPLTRFFFNLRMFGANS
jgi:hypothetical protein